MRNLNKPNRYNVASIQAQQTLGGDVMESAENGQYVEWRDYAWLLSEKQRLQAEVKRLEHESAKWRRAEHAVGDKCIEFAKTIQTLKAEVERLRKAGDAMQKRLIFLHDRWDSDEPNVESDAWNTAKEGKPSV